MLDNAQTVLIHDSTFINAESAHFTEVTHNHLHASNTPDAIASLRAHSAIGALFDSNDRHDPPKCHPETRLAVLDNISKWGEGELECQKPVLWLRGGAGAGKSAIAQTMSERWAECETLAASFYFSRTGAGRNHNKYFVATLAYQLLQCTPFIRQHLENVITTDPDLFDRLFITQFLALIIQPLTAPYTHPIPTRLIVIDGLDECYLDQPNRDHEVQQREVLDAITLASTYHIQVPLRFLVVSRPERQIRLSFHQNSLRSLTFIITLDASQWNPDADIELFL